MPGLHRHVDLGAEAAQRRAIASTTSACSLRSFALASSTFARIGRTARDRSGERIAAHLASPSTRTSRSGVAATSVPAFGGRTSTRAQSAWRASSSPNRSAGRASPASVDDRVARRDDLLALAARDRVGDRLDVRCATSRCRPDRSSTSPAAAAPRSRSRSRRETRRAPRASARPASPRARRRRARASRRRTSSAAARTTHRRSRSTARDRPHRVRTRHRRTTAAPMRDGRRRD